MKFRRTPNPNRNFPDYCPYCGDTSLFPHEEHDFGWKCMSCLRVFALQFYGQDDAEVTISASPSTAQALHNSLARHGHPVSRNHT